MGIEHKIALVLEASTAVSRNHPWALQKPKSYWGYFPPTEAGKHQETLFYELRGQGYKRTLFQLVFPGQTAGIIKKQPPNEQGYDEHHVRFYENGLMESELEFSRGDERHFQAGRVDGNSYLEEIVDDMRIENHSKGKIKSQLGVSGFSEQVKVPSRKSTFRTIGYVADCYLWGFYQNLSWIGNSASDFFKIYGVHQICQGNPVGAQLLALGFVGDYLTEKFIRPPKGFPPDIYQALKTYLYSLPSKGIKRIVPMLKPQS